jgi:hypothetical protein
VHDVSILENTSTKAAPHIGMHWCEDSLHCFGKRDGDFIGVSDNDGAKDEETSTKIACTKY